MNFDENTSLINFPYGSVEPFYSYLSQTDNNLQLHTDMLLKKRGKRRFP